LRNGKFDAQERELTERAQDFLSIFNLEGIQNELAKNLPYGQQRRVEIAARWLPTRACCCWTNRRQA